MLGAVFRRCNAVLTGGLNGVDAMGEKVSDGVIEITGCRKSPSFREMGWCAYRSYTPCTKTIGGKVFQQDGTCM